MTQVGLICNYMARYHKDPPYGRQPLTQNPHISHVKDLDKRLTRMLRHFSYQYPPPKRETSIPLGLIMVAAEAADPSCPFAQCLSNLIQIAFFSCLQS